MAQILQQGLSFIPTPQNPTTESHFQILRDFDNFAESIRARFADSQMRELQHTQTTTPRADHSTAEVYHHMKFLPKQIYTSPWTQYSGHPTIENYIANTKLLLDEHAEDIYSTKNTSHKNATKKPKETKKSSTITIKPADKNLGIVLLDTDDYIAQCAAILQDQSTYRRARNFPQKEIHKHLHTTLARYKAQIYEHNKRLYRFLLPTATPKKIPQFYGIPKVNKSFETLPPMRPIVAHVNSDLSPTATFLDHCLQPIARAYPDYLHNSTPLVIQLQNLSIPPNTILVTMDVKNLYPSIPQTQCLQVIYEQMHTGMYYCSTQIF